ncbi:tape measure protein [Agathobaculum massiliense]|uniref:tape measure protein n=1 Tax=Agathobaculum massiliense TaxID=3014267 RepID=UPI0036F3D1BD
MPDVSIALSAKDKVSSILKQVSRASGETAKDIDKLQNSLDTLSAAKVDIKTNLSKVQQEVTEARKAFRKLGDAVSEQNYKDKLSELEKLEQQYYAVSKSIRMVENEETSLAGTRSKILNRGGGAESAGSMLGTIGGALATAGFGDMLSGSLSKAAGTLLGSYFGANQGAAVESLLGGTISGASMGAAAGSMILPGIGTAVGAVAGGLIGAVSGGIEAAAQTFEQQDDAFKSYVQESVEGVLAEQAEALTSGSSIAGTREQTKMAFAKALGGDEAADAYLEQVREMAARTNYTYDEITGYTKQLLNSYESTEIFDVLGDLSDATAGLNLLSGDVSLWVSGLNRMRITDKATLEYLNYFSERGLNVYEALSQALGVQESAVQDLVSGGKVSGITAADAILDYIGQEYGGLSDVLAGSYEGLMGNLEDANADLQAAMGERHNEIRKQGLQEQLEWMNGEEGDLMKEAYANIGAFQANLENMRDQMERDAVTAVLTGTLPEEGFDLQLERLQEMAEEYAAAAQVIATNPEGSEAAMEAQAQQYVLLAEAQVMAQNEYNASEGAQILLDSQLMLAETVAADTSADETYYNAGQRLGNKYTEGIAAAIRNAKLPSPTLPSVSTAMWAQDTFSLYTPGQYKSSAIGENRVPRDNMLYLLHEGERVLPAREARAQDRQGSGSVVINMGGSYTVRQESDIDAIAEAVAARVMAERRTLRPV